jgi:hypothetical protein
VIELMSNRTRVMGLLRRARPTAARITAAITACALVAACGSGSPSSPGSSSSSSSSSSSAVAGHPTAAQIQDHLRHQLLQFADCMRSHGVSNFPDPTSPGQDKEFLLGQIPGINTQSPAFQSGRGACKHFLPGGGTVSRTATAQVMAQLLHSSRCLRAHGLTGFPDPTASAPANQSDADVIAFGGPNAPPGAPPVAYLAIPGSVNVNSPVARQAAAACHFRLP